MSPTAQTPLKSYALKLCISPSNKTCSPSDNERLQYATGGLCRERHLQFTLGSDGLLRHSCSGKMVCPENGLTKNGAKIVISGTCTVEDSTFERTPGCLNSYFLLHFITNQVSVCMEKSYPWSDSHLPPLELPFTKMSLC